MWLPRPGVDVFTAKPKTGHWAQAKWCPGRVVTQQTPGVLTGAVCAGGHHRPDVDVITANPKTAGVARWNFLALWGHRLDSGEAAALDFVTKACGMLMAIWYSAGNLTQGVSGFIMILTRELRVERAMV